MNLGPEKGQVRTSEYVRVNMSLVVGMSNREVLTPGKKMLMTFAAFGW